MGNKKDQNEDNNFDNLFKNELDMINEEMKNIDELFKDTKEHFDEVKENPQMSTLRFVQEQTSNLISMKDSKIKMIKSSVDVKKIISDFKYKYDRLEQGEDDGKDLSVELFKEIMKFNNNDKTKDHEPDLDLDEEDIDNAIENILSDDEDIANEIDAIMSDGSAKESNEEDDKKTIVSDIYGKLYTLDNETDEVSEEGVPEGIEVVNIRIDEESDEYYVKCSDGNKYEIVDIDLS